ncbi:MAG TPA: HPr(Ser) kinase/phosphatase [Candidatus Polarisedimenticolia bacterium]|nr:HPr(Ser) kinase/phosphatase [Candidatus Polarisedimenticolia bacterium]
MLPRDLPTATPKIRVRDLLLQDAAHLDLHLIAGFRGVEKEITVPRIQKPGLSLAGFIEYIHPGRVQILGQSEITFLQGQTSERRSEILTQVCGCGVTCFVITKNLDPPQELLDTAEAFNIPLLKTRLVSSVTIDGLTSFLEERLAPRLSLHGVLLDIYGVGVLLLGESGVGKSECALDLIVRGHRLVSDDIVELKRRGNILNGSGPELTRYHMEVRGLGIINIKDLFGVAAVRYLKDLDMIVRLAPWQEGKEYERLGLDQKTHEILGVSVPYIEMPVAPGRHLSVLVEVAARNHLLKTKGYDPARELASRLEARLADGSGGS